MTGFSRLMGEDESRAVTALMQIRDVFAAVVPRHGGTLDVFVGDCFVALFGSAVEAVQAAIAIQAELARASGPQGAPVRIRIGIHLGDVVRSGNDILGDSVNVAARIQAIAPPGGITISEDVYRAVRNRVKVPARDLGLKSLKNIRERMRIYAIDPSAAAAESPAPPARRSPRPLLLTIGLVGAAAAAAVAVYLARPALLVGGSAPGAAAPPAAPAAAELITVGVTGVSARGEVPPWMQDTTRDGLNTLLSKVRRLRVFSREKIDFLRQRRGLSEIEVAETLGIQKMISGSMAMENGDVVLEVRVVDISTGILDASESLRAPPGDLIELQNQMASTLISTFGVNLSPIEREELFAQRTKDTLDAYRRLADTFGEAPPGSDEPPKPRPRTSWLRWTDVAWAQDAAHDEVLAVLEAYRAALEHEDVDAVAATHVSLSDEQRDGFVRYFASAEGLTVTLSGIDVLFDGDEGLATFTRRDAFHDRDSGKEMQLEVRLSSVVVRQDGRWLLRGVRRS
jgi:adenylate cyclase